jgi:hypothetical protein
MPPLNTIHFHKGLTMKVIIDNKPYDLSKNHDCKQLYHQIQSKWLQHHNKYPPHFSTQDSTYNLTISDDRKSLAKHIKGLDENKQEHCLTSLTDTLHQAHQIDSELLAMIQQYRKITIQNFNAAPQTLTQQRQYCLIQNTYYALPQTSDNLHPFYTLLTQLLYEHKRHAIDTTPCITITTAIKRWLPMLSPLEYDAFIETCLITLQYAQTEHHTYFAEQISSDSEPETNIEKHEQTKAKQWRQRSKNESYNRALINKKMPSIKARDRRTLTPQPNEPQIEKDLEKINAKIKAGETITTSWLSKLNHSFEVAQYRGIHYFTTSWGAYDRRKHRSSNEIDEPQYASAVLAMANIDDYTSYLKEKNTNPSLNIQLEQHAQTLQDALYRLQHTKPVDWHGYVYSSEFYLLQHWYTWQYDQYPQRITLARQQDNTYAKQCLPTSQRPFVSTGDVPLHAVRYAHGCKLYKGHEDDALKPNWRADGSPERRKVGKVYVALLSIDQMSQHNPSHVPSLFCSGEFPLSNIISAEAETSFLAKLPKGCVKITHVTRYPSFKGPHPPHYAVRYGLDNTMYKTIQKLMLENPPHSHTRTFVETCLSDYLCAYQEVRMVALAEAQAQEDDKILVYRNETGLYTRTAPQVATTANRSLRKMVMKYRSIRRDLSTNQSNQVVPMTQKQCHEIAEKNDLHTSPAVSKVIATMFHDKKASVVDGTEAPKPYVLPMNHATT